MACYIYFYQQIASRTSICARFTFITDTDTLTIVNTSWNRYLNFFAIGNVAGTTAIRTFIFDNFASTMTIRTHLNVTNHAKHGLLGVNDLSFTITFRTGNR